MSVNLSPVAGAAAQFLDNSGNVLTGGKLYTYLAGTTTPAATYTSSTGTQFHTNPIILDAAGRVPNGGEIWLSDNVQYKFVLKDANDVLIGTWDNLVGINSNFVNYTSQEEIIVATAGQTVFNLNTVTYVPGTNSLQVYVDGVNQYDGITYAYVETDATTVTFTAGLHVGALVKFTTAVSVSAGSVNANLVIYDPPFTGGVTTNAEAKFAQTVSVKDFGAVGDGVTNDYVAFQAAYDGVEANATIFIPSGTYICQPAITFSGTKRVHWVTNTDTRWVTDQDLDNVFVESFNTTSANNWRSHEYFADNNDGSGGLLQTYLVREATAAGGAYQWDGHRIHVINKESGGGGVTGQAIFAYIDSSNPSGKMWCQNLYAYAQAGGDGTLRGSEINIDNRSSVVKEVGQANNKLGVLATTKTLAGTAGFVVGPGAGDGWYKGFIVLQNGIVNDADARAFEYRDLFEVMYDGTVLVGKGTNTVFSNGVIISPTGAIDATATGTYALLTFNRTETLSTITNIGEIVARGKNSADASTVFANIIFTAVDPTDTTEDGRVAFQTQVAGTLATRAYVQDGIVVGNASGGDKGAGTINVSSGVYLNGTAYTNPDYVFEKAYTGKIEKFADKVGAGTYEVKSIEEAEQYTKDNLALPGFGQDAKLDYLGGSEMLLARLEEAYLYIFELNKRIKALESK